MSISPPNVVFIYCVSNLETLGCQFEHLPNWLKNSLILKLQDLSFLNLEQRIAVEIRFFFCTFIFGWLDNNGAQLRQNVDEKKKIAYQNFLQVKVHGSTVT